MNLCLVNDNNLHWNVLKVVDSQNHTHTHIKHIQYKFRFAIGIAWQTRKFSTLMQMHRYY